MIDYDRLRRKFPGKNPDKKRKAAKIKAIAHEYERKRAELGAGAPEFRRGFPYYMVILIGLMLVGALVIPQIFRNGADGFDKGKKNLAIAKESVHALAVALGRFRFHTGLYPTTEQGLAFLALKKLHYIDGWNGPYITRPPFADPWHHDYVYVYNGESETPTLYSKGPDGVAGSTDDIIADPADFDLPFRDTSWTNGWMPYHLRGYVVALNERHRRQIEAELEALRNPNNPVEGRTVLSEGWEFAQVWKDTQPGTGVEPVADPGFASTNLVWQPVRVPHDWAIEGPFKAACTDGSTGKLPWRGVGYYRRMLVVPERAAGKFMALRFNGVMARPEVFLNGEKIGGWDYGYMGFEVDVTDKIRIGKANELVVRADTTAHGSRWYPGAGLVRDVAFVIEDAQNRIIDGSLHIFAREITEELAKMRAVWRTPAGAQTNDFEVANPIFWSPERPFLHHTEIQGREFAFGIRTAVFTADDGFHLNGARYQLKGVNLHADYGPLGAIFNREAARRVLTTMKEMGVNAIRTSHNPVDPGFLDLCDEMGFLVWDECFDKWDHTAGLTPDEDQDEFVIRNLRAFVRRDRNHPSVICWSIGNEIPPDTGNPWTGETSHPPCPQGVNNARCAKYREAVLEEDATRPVGIGCCFSASFTRDDYKSLDLTGWNYRGQYADMKKAWPDKPVVYSESASTLSSWGYFPDTPSANPTNFDEKTTVRLDAYDRCAAGWADIPDADLARMERDRYCAGEFVWTGVDYLGEPTPNPTLCRSSFFGICDLTGLPKDRYYLYRSQWNTRDDTIHLLPHWNWEGKEGQPITVMCYTSGDEAELFVNGESAGRRKKLDSLPPVVAKDHPDYYKVTERYRLVWEVPYEPGEIKVLAFRKGRLIGEDVRRTAFAAAAVRLTPETTSLADGELGFVTVEVVDDNGTVLPLADDRVSFTLTGPGEIAAVGNGSPDGLDSFADTASHPLYFGRALVIVRRTGGSGMPVKLKATAKGLRAAMVEFKFVKRRGAED